MTRCTFFKEELFLMDLKDNLDSIVNDAGIQNHCDMQRSSCTTG